MAKEELEKFWYDSSSPKGGLSLTIGSLSLGGLIPVLFILFNLLGLEVSESDIANYLAAVVGLVSSIGILAGLGRKFYYFIKRTK